MPLITRRTLAAALMTASGFACYWTYLTLNQERLLFDARRRPPRDLPDGIIGYSHLIPGGVVRGYIYHTPGDNVRDLLFYLPGRGEDVLETLQYARWLPAGMAFATYDYRGLGHSDGLPSEGAAVADASQFLLHARRVFPDTRVHVVGRSLGTGVAIQLADLQDFESLQLITPYDSLLELVRKRFPLVPLRQLMRHHFDSISHCKKVVQSTKVLLAETDEVVPHECSERLMAAWPGPVALQTVPATDHFTIIEHEETWLALCEFARQHSQARLRVATAQPAPPPAAGTPPVDHDELGNPLPLAASR
ncbi:alpha/beta hydrolase [Cupriavidus necator]|uniref:Alpha/beta hydrolase n=1 Tax=Cupriavidus necator TaxID=106590 RepID=A0A367PAE3_CUPNE|nr:alpha/beta hydrolase [Cupriavidus necator]QQX86824.1 alpha/beta hydrolase [Cupriavidus necator]RCJ04838.1 alpha/beta hydrolase [Cupriavidus necator]